MHIMLRADITQDEWLRIRTIALQTKTPTARLVADALRRDRVTKQAFKQEDEK